MNIDPRLLTTPIGAAVGALLAKKMLRKEDQTTGRIAAGAAVGGGVGLLGGEAMRAHVDTADSSEEAKRILGEHLLRTRPTGAVQSQELEALNKIKPIYPVDTLKNTWDPRQLVKRQLMLANTAALEQGAGQSYRAKFYEQAAAEAQDPAEKQDFQAKAKASADAASDAKLSSAISSAFSGTTLGYSIPLEYIKNIANTLRSHDL